MRLRMRNVGLRKSLFQKKEDKFIFFGNFDFFNTIYKLPNGEEYCIKGERHLLDFAEIGET